MIGWEEVHDMLHVLVHGLSSKARLLNSFQHMNLGKQEHYTNAQADSDTSLLLYWSQSSLHKRKIEEKASIES